MLLQCYMETRDSVSGVADFGSGSPFKKGGQRMCCNYRDITLITAASPEDLLQGAGEQSQAFSLTADARGTMWYSSRTWKTRPSR